MLVARQPSKKSSHRSSVQGGVAARAALLAIGQKPQVVDQLKVCSQAKGATVARGVGSPITDRVTLSVIHALKRAISKC